MTVVVKRPQNLNTAFGQLFDEFFRDLPVRTNPVFAPRTRPAVNVVEMKEAFCIELAAPGLEKADFDINIDKDLLTIRAKKEFTLPEDATFRRREFSGIDIERSFQLPETIETGAIEARYENGILYLTLPKKEEAVEKPARKVEIA